MQICINCFEYEPKPRRVLASIHKLEVFIYPFFQRRCVATLSVDHTEILTSYVSSSLLQIKYHSSDMKPLYIKTSINIFKIGKKKVTSSQKTKYLNRKESQVLNIIIFTGPNCGVLTLRSSLPMYPVKFTPF